MDILDKLLDFAQLSAGISVKCQLQGNWELDNPHQSGLAVAHIISAGCAYLEHNGQVHLLKQGDIAFFPKFSSHTLRSQIQPLATKTLLSLESLGAFTSVKTGKAQYNCDMFCLHYHYDSQSELMDTLPEMILFQIAETPLQMMLDLLRTEATASHLATKSLVNSLALVILTMILRQHLANHNHKLCGVLKGWQELRLRPLLKAILLNPEKDWTVDKMAATVHLSRSQLIRLFNQHLSISPHAFVHKMRLQKAAMLLKSQADSVLSIALTCGFQSEPHFITAFKRQYAVTPSQYRKLNTK
ncbi:MULTISPECIES: helix-turn-helix domain-containing protein [Mannheimia]|uniref:Helix-turn-helix transcriptional regulator n=1 Tax=Mannheimia pernigra TaxID=111844 RepID=A0A7D5HRA7_9PAST|nr:MULTISPECIES: AraC family transcriptional regulator [Mannheimia]QHB18164.1 helix-turn-helix domain-containing protein [Mannheimia pernigra]QLB41014.1 helix-turn-helix transcriptional regulator [Mannheimia pernigra]QLB42952.1 helix-turn-helix transcriptional regulator [Mannheimia pernigra]QTM01631.1 helix-turn-helix domain-containing protein [Mannheimia sp. ZY171111]